MSPVVRRTYSALVAAALVVAVLWFVPFKWVCPLLLAFILLVELEFLQLAAKKYEVMLKPALAAGLAYLGALVYFVLPGRSLGPGAVALGAALLAWIWTAALFGPFRQPLVALGITFAAFVYLPLMLSALVIIPYRYGMPMLLYVIAIVKIADMGGFAFGVLFGRHKLCPTISPNKTWEGLGGSVFGSLLISTAFMPLTGFGWSKSLLCGVIAALVGTFGDLVESRIKRECGVKDSSTFLPAGMGGLLDMFDSLVFAPVALLPFL